MTKLNIKQIQDVQFQILKKFINICEELNIKYIMAYGSLLGTVRHHDFIPWDDDLDVAMTDYDYKKFEEYCIKNKKKIYPLELHNQKTKENLFYNISRLTDERYLLKYYGMSKCIEGIFIDIYRMEPVGNASDENYWKKVAKKEKKYRKRMYMIAHDGFRFHRWYNTPLMIWSKLLGKDHYLKRLNSTKKIKWSESSNIGHPYWADPIIDKCGVPKSFLKDIIQIKFRDIYVNVPKEYDKYLKILYGDDYMELPPKNERRGKHGYIAYKREKRNDI